MPEVHVDRRAILGREKPARDFRCRRGEAGGIDIGEAREAARLGDLAANTRHRIFVAGRESPDLGEGDRHVSRT